MQIDRLILKSIKIFFQDTFVYPLKLIIHPIAKWDDFKREKEAKRWVSIYFLIALIITLIIHQTSVGFMINDNKQDFKLFQTILSIILPIIAFVISSYSVGSLFNGKGKMPEIFDMLCYSSFPLIIFTLIATIISNYIGIDEVNYYQIFMGIGIFLSCWMLFFGLMGVHQNSLGANIIHIIFTIVVVAVITFVVLLFFSFIDRIIGWISSIVNEIKMRYF